jgi:hypothetical protein
LKFWYLAACTDPQDAKRCSQRQHSQSAAFCCLLLLLDDVGRADTQAVCDAHTTAALAVADVRLAGVKFRNQAVLCNLRTHPVASVGCATASAILQLLLLLLIYSA